MTTMHGDTSALPNVRHCQPQPLEPDLRWLPESDEERAVTAHVRGWCHLSTACAICRVESQYADVRTTLESIVRGHH